MFEEGKARLVGDFAVPLDGDLLLRNMEKEKGCASSSLAFVTVGRDIQGVSDNAGLNTN